MNNFHLPYWIVDASGLFCAITWRRVDSPITRKRAYAEGVGYWTASASNERAQRAPEPPFTVAKLHFAFQAINIGNLLTLSSDLLIVLAARVSLGLQRDSIRLLVEQYF